MVLAFASGEGGAAADTALVNGDGGAAADTAFVRDEGGAAVDNRLCFMPPPTITAAVAATADPDLIGVTTPSRGTAGFLVLGSVGGVG